jgi:S-formylglutathione hydrolase
VLEETMTRFGIGHTYEEYDGDHTNRVADRIENHVLPFFSDHLAFSAKTAPATARR